MTAEHEHGDGTPRWVIGIGLGLVLVATLVAAGFMIFGGDDEPSKPAADTTPTMHTDNDRAEDMTPPPARCPNVGMVPPPAGGRRAGRVSSPPAKPAVYAPEEEVVTMTPADYGRVRLIPAPPKDGSYTPFVRVPVTAGYGLDAYGPPANSEWIEDRPEGVDSEGYARIRWANKPGAVPVTEIQLRLR